MTSKQAEDCERVAFEEFSSKAFVGTREDWTEHAFREGYAAGRREAIAEVMPVIEEITAESGGDCEKETCQILKPHYHTPGGVHFPWECIRKRARALKEKLK